jgi:hypothetical protein
VLIVGRGIAAWARRTMRRGLERARIDASLIPFPQRDVHLFQAGTNPAQ